jgi:ureidoacrylate peracid hydrolase
MGELTMPSEHTVELEQALHPRHTALLIHDMQNDFCTREGKIYRRAAKRPETIATVVQEIAKLASAARQAGVKIVYLQQMHLPDLADIPKAHVNHLKKNGLAGTADDVPCIRGTWGHRIVDALAPQPADIVVDKGSFNDFYSSLLDKVLHIQGINTTVLTGVSSHSGVMGTYFGVHDHGYELFIAREGVMGYDAAMHEAAMTIYRPHTIGNADLMDIWARARGKTS